MQLTKLLCTQLRFLMQAQAYGMGNILEPDQALLSSSPNTFDNSCTSSTSSHSEVNSGPEENHYQHCRSAPSMEPSFDGLTSSSQSSNAAANDSGTSVCSRVSLRLEGDNHQHSSNDHSMEDPSSDGLVPSSQTSGTEANIDIISVNHEVSFGVEDYQQSDDASSMESSSDGLTSSPDGLTSFSDGLTSFSPAPTAEATSRHMQATCSQASADEASTSLQTSSNRVPSTDGSSIQVAWADITAVAVQSTSQISGSQAPVEAVRISSPILDGKASVTEASTTSQQMQRLRGVASVVSSSSQPTGSQTSANDLSSQTTSGQTTSSQDLEKASSQPTCSHAAFSGVNSSSLSTCSHSQLSVSDAVSQTMCSQTSTSTASASSQSFGKHELSQSAHLGSQQPASRSESFCKKVWQFCKLPQALKAAQHMLLHFLRLLPVTHPSPPTGQSDCDSPDSDKLERQLPVPFDTVQLSPSAADGPQADALLHTAQAAVNDVNEQDTAASGGDAVQSRNSLR